MSACNTSCTTVGDLVVRVARQLGDYSDTDEVSRFTTWSKETLIDYYNEAALLTVANRPDAFADTVEITLKPGSLQTIPEGYRAFAKIELNVNTDGTEASPVVPGDEYFTKIMAKKACLADACTTSASDYAVKSFTKSNLSDTEFAVSPPVPAGMSPRVKAVLIKNPAKVCPGDFDKCVQFNAIYSPAIVEWMLYRAWSGDAEILGGANQAALHRNTFYQILGVQLQREREFFSGAFRPTQPVQQVQR